MIIAPNYYRACVELSWDEQEDQFASLLLINAFALHESWISEILDTLRQPNRNLEKQLQFPSKLGESGIFEAIATLTAIESTFLKDAFYSIFSSGSKFCFHELNNLMVCYRYFKELRNSFMHHGGIVSQRLEDASIAFELLHPIDLKAKEIPAFIPMRIGGQTKLVLRGVVGFLDIILKIVATLDAELLRSFHAEIEFEKRWRETHLIKPSLKKATQSRQIKIAGLVRKCRFPRPNNTQLMENWLCQKNFIN